MPLEIQTKGPPGGEHLEFIFKLYSQGRVLGFDNRYEIS
jgi:hypothetical protein